MERTAEKERGEENRMKQPTYNKHYGIFTLADRPTDWGDRSLMPAIMTWYYTIMSSNGGIVIKSELR